MPRQLEYDREQDRLARVEASWVEYERFHEVTDAHLLGEARARIRALEAALADLLRYAECGHATDESACCTTCHARRLLSRSVPS